jgi:hypothetical protein
LYNFINLCGWYHYFHIYIPLHELQMVVLYMFGLCLARINSLWLYCGFQSMVVIHQYGSTKNWIGFIAILNFVATSSMCSGMTITWSHQHILCNLFKNLLSEPFQLKCAICIGVCGIEQSIITTRNHGLHYWKNQLIKLGLWFFLASYPTWPKYHFGQVDWQVHLDQCFFITILNVVNMFNNVFHKIYIFPI